MTAPGGQQVVLARDRACQVAAVPGSAEDWLLHSGEQVLDELPALPRPRSQARAVPEEPGDAEGIAGRLLRRDQEER